MADVRYVDVLLETMAISMAVFFMTSPLSQTLDVYGMPAEVRYVKPLNLLCFYLNCMVQLAYGLYLPAAPLVPCNAYGAAVGVVSTLVCWWFARREAQAEDWNRKAALGTLAIAALSMLVFAYAKYVEGGAEFVGKIGIFVAFSMYGAPLASIGEVLRNLGLVNGTPLALASRQGHQEVVRVLLKASAWVDEASAGYPPLFLAAAAGQAPVVRQLLKACADKDLRTANGNALGAASSMGHADVVRALIDAGAVKPKGLTDTNMLFVVAFKGHLDVMRLLIENRIEQDRPVHKRDHLAMTTTLFANGNRLFAMWIIMPACTLSSMSEDPTSWKKPLLVGAVILSIVALYLLGGDEMKREIRGKWAAFFEWKYLCLCYIRHYIMKYK